MTLPSGIIGLWDVNRELGRPATQAISLGETAVRNLAGRPSGYCDMNSLRGKSAYAPMNVTPNNVYEVTSSGNTQPYTGRWSPSVYVTGGSGNFSYNWSFANQGVFTLESISARYCTVSARVPRFGLYASCAMTCVVVDNVLGNAIGVNVYVEITTDNPM